MSNKSDPVIEESLLESTAIAAACVFEDKHLAFATESTKAAVRLTVVQLVAASVLAYLHKARVEGA